MTPWTFNVKLPHGTEFTFESLMFAVGEDGDLKMLPPGPALEHLALAPSSTSGVSSDQDLSDDYPEIGTSAYGKPVKGSRLILMVAPNRDQLHNSSSRYPIIGRSEHLMPKHQVLAWSET
jgi:hypothetical protein